MGALLVFCEQGVGMLNYLALFKTLLFPERISPAKIPAPPLSNADRIVNKGEIGKMEVRQLDWGHSKQGNGARV
jgi:hypothetical protein